MIDTTTIKADLTGAISDMPISVTIGSSTYTGRKSIIDKEKRVGEYGFTDDYSFTVIFLKDNIPSIPGNMTRVTISSVQYRIIKKEEDAFGIFVRFHLAETI